MKTNPDYVETWKTDPSQLPEVVKSLEVGDNRADLEHDKYYAYSYFDRPIVDHRIQGEFIDDSSVMQNGWNLTREVVDTAVAVICRPVSTTVIPVGADAATARNCEVISRFAAAVNDVTRTEAKKVRAYRTGCLCRFGAIRFYIRNGEMGSEWVNPFNVRVRYGIDGDVTEVYLVTAIPRSKLMAMYPSKAEAIRNASTYREEPIPGVDPSSYRSGDMVAVYEAYSAKFAEKNGQYLSTLDNGIVLDRAPWKYTFVPMAFVSWSPGWRGVAGKSLAAIVNPYHRLANKIIAILGASARGAVARVMRHTDDEVNQALTDFPLEEVLWSGVHKPEVIAPPNVISRELLDLLDRARARAFGESGVSEMIANNTRPQGLNSGPAQNAWVDIASVRSFERQAAWEQFNKDCLRIQMALAAEAYANKSIRAMAPGSKMLEEIKWPKDFREDQYEYRVTVGSGLPLTLSGRIQAISEIKTLAPSQITDAQIVKALAIPDVEETRDNANAYLDMVQKQIDTITSDGRMIVPSELQGVDGLEAGVRLGSQAYMRAFVAGNVPPAHVEMLRRYVLHCKKRLGVLTGQGLPQAQPLPAPAPAPSLMANTIPALPAPQAQLPGAM